VKGPSLAGIVLVLSAALVPTVVVPAAEGRSSRVRPHVSNQLPWHGKGVWLQGDTHSHYILSKARGHASVASARDSGLDFIAATEHTGDAFGPYAESRLHGLRGRYPEVILLAGIEWNLPAGDHATVIVDIAENEMELLEEFARRFDRELNPELVEAGQGLRSGDEHSTGRDAVDDAPRIAESWGDLSQAIEGLRWLDEQAGADGTRAVVYLNHPGKYDWLTVEQIEQLRDAGLAGVAAAPGHQNSDPFYSPYAIDRHEPMVIRVGGGYDRLITDGHTFSVMAGSDYHNKRTSYPPGVFSRTFVNAPSRSASGIVDGLAEGATATVLGGIVTSIATRTTAKGLHDAAEIAETLTVPVGTRVTYRVIGEVPEYDFEDRPNRIDRVEIISDCAGETRIVHTSGVVEPGKLRVEFKLPAEFTDSAGICFLRARGRRLIGEKGNGVSDADYLFHTAPTHLEVVPSR